MLGRLILIAISLLVMWPIGVSAQEAEPSQSAGDSRLWQAVQEFNINLNDDRKNMIINKCQIAQNSLNDVLRSTDVLIQKRRLTYVSIQKDLQAIKLRMTRQGADASETDLLTGKLQQLLDRLSEQAGVYTTALSDVINVDCHQKPEYFQGGLVMMRLERARLYDITNGLKALIDNADNEIFTQLKRRLVI